VVAIIVTGGLAGWIAARLISGAGYGLVINVIVGIIGGKLFAVLDIPVGSWFVELGMAVLGAVLLLGIVNLLRRRTE
jgi:uncharacterized membrane protein YeaQ/YmgE (transglycosylase-associated protein family)